MNIYIKLSVLIALPLYLPLARQILKRQVTQNLASFILWAALDVVAAASIMVQGGNWLLPGAYVFGCLMVIAALLIVKTWKWTRFETFVSMLVIVCLIGWSMSGPRLATILSTLGVVLAGAPQIVDAYKKPWEQPLLFYIGVTVANVLSTIGGKAWTIEERFYPAWCVVLCGLMVLFICRRYLPSRTLRASEG